MPVISRVVAAILFAICAATASAVGATEHLHEADENIAIRWAIEHYDAVSAEVFGSPTSSTGLGLNTLWVVTVRIRPASDIEPEVQFSLTKLGNGEVTAVVTKLRSGLQLQLQRLHAGHERAAASEIAKLIAVDRFVFSHSGCPALTKIATSFEKARTAVALENTLIMDPRQYQLWVDAGSQQLYVNLLGASNGASRHPIIRWIEDASEQLRDACPERTSKRKD